MIRRGVKFFVPILIFALCIMNTSVYAIDLSRTGSITVTIRSSEGNHDLAGNVTLKIYKVADVYENEYNIDYVYTPDFADCGINLDDLSSEGLASHFAAYAAQYNIAGRTESGNPVIFDNLTLGLYLIVQVGMVEGYYPIAPFIVSIPMVNAEGTDLDYDVSADPKVKTHPTDTSETLKKIRVSVKKVWVGINDDIPESVEITLLRNGLIFDSVTLSGSNDWKYTWSGLDSGYNWSVAEINVPAGYEVSYFTAGSTYTITNTTVPTDPTNPTNPTNPTDPTVPTDPTNPTNPASTKDDEDHPNESSEQSDKTKLPQTGQLNWPILVLASAGIALFMIGWGLTFLGNKSDK